MRASSILALMVLKLGAWGMAGPEQIALTIYNQNFAVVRQLVQLDLTAGDNKVRFADTTAHLEPDSVMLRDPEGLWNFRILEQNYRADPVSQALLLSFYEGETIEFLVRTTDGPTIEKGRIVRSGYVPHRVGLRQYGNQYYANQMALSGGGAGQPILEIDGKLRFGLPGTPLFPRLTDDTILKPTLDWTIESDRQGKLDAELGYVTGGMSWEADYNVIAPEEGDILRIVGWVTIDNQSGKTFPDARIKLMAGDVSKIQPGAYDAVAQKAVGYAMRESGAAVTEKAFDDYHLYTLQRSSTLHDRETKQVEFIRTEGVTSNRIYVYDGARIDINRYRGYSAHNLRQDANYGVESNSKVWIMQEFHNSEENQLGMPLPKGLLRFYRQDHDGQLEFTGENIIDHTPRDEIIRVNTGSAFDLVGERIRTDFQIDTRGHWVDESFDIRLRNHKEEPVEIRVVEHLYRWVNWELTSHSDEYEDMDSQTIEFRITVQPDEEEKVSYTVHYSW